MTDIINIEGTSDNLYNKILAVLNDARTTAYRSINTTMVEAYWNVGRLIVEAQGGEAKAKYGDDLINRIAKKLTQLFGRGFAARNLRNMRQFYLAFPIWQTVSAKLSWSHYQLLMKVTNEKARQYYAEEASKAPWSVRSAL